MMVVAQLVHELLSAHTPYRLLYLVSKMTRVYVADDLTELGGRIRFDESESGFANLANPVST